jgi:hypothetical protein
MIIEMLLNNDIQKKLFKWFYTFKRKKNLIMYIIEKKLN